MIYFYITFKQILSKSRDIYFTNISISPKMAQANFFLMQIPIKINTLKKILKIKMNLIVLYIMDFFVLLLKWQLFT